MKRHGQPHVLVTDKLRSYGAAMKDIGNADRQETGRWLNNRAENSHLPFPTARTRPCNGSGACEVCRNSPPFIHQPITISIRSDTFTHAQTSS